MCCFLDLCKKAIAKRKEVETSSTKTILYVYLNSCVSQLDYFFYLKIVTFDKGSGKLLEARGFLFLHSTQSMYSFIWSHFGGLTRS